MGLGEFSWVGTMQFPQSAYICNHDICSVMSLRRLCKKWNLNRTQVQGYTFESIAENVCQIHERFPFHGVKAIRWNLWEQHQNHVPRLLYITLYSCSWRSEDREWGKSGLMLDVGIRKSTAVLELLSDEDQALVLVVRNLDLHLDDLTSRVMVLLIRRMRWWVVEDKAFLVREDAVHMNAVAINIQPSSHIEEYQTLL